MKKLLLILVIACLVCNVSAAAPLVIDNAGLLSAQEISDLTVELQNLRDTLGIDVVVVTEDDMGGVDSITYADNYYDENGYGDHGTLLLINMEQMEWWISTCGSCIDNVDIDAIESVMLPLLGEGSFYKAFATYADYVRMDMTGIEISDEVITATFGDARWFKGLGICLVIGIVIGGITVAVMSGGMKTVRTQSGASNYIKDGSLQLSIQEDRYLYTTVTKRPKPKNNSGGGVHSSSSGRSHGGGGGKF